MNLQDLSEKYLKSPRVFELVDKLSFSKPSQVYLKNLRGSSPEFILSAIFQHESSNQLNHLVVLNDAEEAAYFHNTLENLTRALDLFYFPSSFKNRKNYSILNSSHVMLRTEALSKLSLGGNKKLIITYPEALAEKVVFQKALADSIINIRTAETIDPDGLMRTMNGYNFERTDFVYQPGQFALRGGILDIYSFGNEKPYRIELFGNEVDSIRIFDPETQLSERKLLQVSIIPNIETHFGDEEKVSLLEFIPEKTVIWLHDWDVIKEKLVDQEDELQQFFERKELASPQDDENQEKADLSPKDFTDTSTLYDQMLQKHVVEFGYSSNFNAAGDERKTELLEFATKEQPAFNRQFDLLIKDLKSWEAKKYSIYLFADNPRQLERLHSIFTDLKTEIPFIPVPVSIHEGFIDDDLKIVCYTDHQIFQRYHKYKVKQAYNKNKAITLRTLRDLQPGDYVTHIDHGVGTYSGLQKIEANGRIQEAVRIIYRDNDILYVNINSLHKISKYTGKEGTVPKINKIGSDVWNKLKEKTKTKVKEIAFDLIKLYAKRKAEEGFAHSPDNYMQTELEASFIYEDTPDQSKATGDV
ncbi:MAG: CarD family transcriptional regulator, partial [Chitinophagaceae bacterium]